MTIKINSASSDHCVLVGGNSNHNGQGPCPHRSYILVKTI